LNPGTISSQSASNRLCEAFLRRESKFTLAVTSLFPCEWAERLDDRVDERLRTNSVIVEFPLGAEAGGSLSPIASELPALQLADV
jgi:hypothetical protein